jgi:hypothetical protein
MASVRNLRVKSLDSIGQYGALELRRVFPLSCSNDTLIEVFCETCIKNGFVLTDRGPEKATAIKEVTNMYAHEAPHTIPNSGFTALSQAFHFPVQTRRVR